MNQGTRSALRMKLAERIRSRLLAPEGAWAACLRYWLRRAGGLVLPWFFRGDRCECPCCGGHFRRFMTFRTSGWRMENARCPRCGSFQRQRVLWLYLQRETNLLSRPIRVLQIAPDLAFFLRLSALGNVDYVTGDLQRSPMISRQMDITQLPFGADRFDLILCSHVLEHVPDDRRALGELKRVLRPDGLALLQHPINDIDQTDEDPAVVDPDERLRRWGQADHVRTYGHDYLQRLADAGFQAELLAYHDQLPEATVQRYGLRDQSTTRSQDIAVCRIPPA
jgi:SAM-dependent methyltransferase